MRKLLTISCLVLASVSVGHAQFDYQKVLKKYIGDQLKNSQCSLDKDFKDTKKWQIMTYPVSNFGLLTVYDRQGDGSYSHLEDMWATLGFTDAEVPQDFATWIRMDGFAGAGTGGAVSIVGSQDKRKLGLGFVFPKLLGVLGLNISFDKDSTTVVDMSVESFTARCLRRAQADGFLNGHDAEPQNHRKVNSSIMNHFTSGDLAIVVGDVVAKNIVVTIKPDLTTTAAIEAKVGPDVTNKIFGTDTDLKFNYQRVQKGTYTFTISNPVVVARLIKSQPSGGVSATAQAYEDFPAVEPTKIPLPIVKTNSQ